MIRAELERRPLLILCLGLILGLTLPQHPIHFLLLLPGPWILTALRSRALIVFGLLAGVLLGPIPGAILTGNQFISGDWSVCTMPKIQALGQSCEIQAGQVRLELDYDGPIDLCPGSTIRVRGVAKPPTELSEAYFRVRGLVGRVEARGAAVQVVSDGPRLQRMARDWRSGFLRFTAANLPARAAFAVDAICFHVDGLIDGETHQEIMRTGTVHLMAASGLYVILIAFSLQWMLQFLPIPRRVQLLLLSIILILYAVATGSQASIIRVVAMSLIASSAYLFKREPDWLSALAFTSILYLLWFPFGIYDAGFQLSFIAVLYLALFSEHFRGAAGLESRVTMVVRKSVRTALIAYVIIAPMIANFFGSISLLTVPLSLLIVLATVPIVIIAMAAYPLNLVFPWLGGIVVKATIPLTTFVYSVLDTYGGPGTEIQTPPFSPYWLVPYYLFLLILWRPHVRQP